MKEVKKEVSGIKNVLLMDDKIIFKDDYILAHEETLEAIRILQEKSSEEE